MEIEGLIIPQKWCDALAECQLKDPTAIIAGGCLRDLYFGREPKDVDIFTGQLPDWPLLDESSFDYEGMQYVLGVADYKRDDIKYNVIIVEPVAPNILIETFDLGFCQIAFDGKTLIKSQAFLWDAKYQLITLHHTDRYSRSIRRYARINERYNFDLIIPVLEKANGNADQSTRISGNIEERKQASDGSTQANCRKRFSA